MGHARVGEGNAQGYRALFFLHNSYVVGDNNLKILCLSEYNYGYDHIHSIVKNFFEFLKKVNQVE